MNSKNSSRVYVVCTHTLIQSDFIDIWDCSPRLQSDEEDVEICSNYIVINKVYKFFVLYRF